MKAPVSSGLPQGQGLWGEQTWVQHKPSWRRSPLTASYSCQNLHRTGETDSRRAQTEPCAHQDPGESSSGPAKARPRLAWECPGVSSGGVGSEVACCRVGGTECSSVCLGPSEGGHHYLHYLPHSLSVNCSVMPDSL